MKINITLKTVQNLGDHGREVTIALDTNQTDSIQNIVDNYLFNDKFEPNHNDHLEIRIAK